MLRFGLLVRHYLLAVTSCLMMLGFGVACGGSETSTSQTDAGVDEPDVSGDVGSGADADAGPDWSVNAVIDAPDGEDIYIGQRVELDGSESSTDGDMALEFRWAFHDVPEGSEAELRGWSEAEAYFVPDMPGTYEVELVVSAGEVEDSATASVEILPCLEPRELSGRIEEDEHWTALPGACPSYLVTDDVSIRAAIEVDPGVHILFEESTSFVVTSGGSLNVEATEEDPVVCEGTEHEKGWWRGIQFRTAETHNRLHHVEIRHAGGGDWDAAIDVGGGTSRTPAQLRLEDSTIEQSGSNGLFVRGGDRGSGSLAAFSNNVFAQNELAPIRIQVNEAGKITSDTVFVENGRQSIDVYRGRLEDAASWEVVDVPYVMEIDLSLRELLTLEPGVNIAFEAGLKVSTRWGGLSARGEENNPIVFYGTDESPGWWYGIEVSSAHAQNHFEHVEVRHAGDGDATAAIYVDSASSASLNLVNTAIVESASRGLHVNRNSTLESFAQNSFIRNAEAPIAIRSEHIDAIDSESNFEDNGEEYILLTSGFRLGGQAATMSNPGIPYLFHDDFSVDHPLVIEDGTVLKFGAGHQLAISLQGSLTAIGESANPIIFEGESDEPGYWKGIYLARQNGAVHQLHHTEIRHAGHDNWTAGSSSERPPSAVMVGRSPYSVTADIRDSHFEDIGRTTEDNAVSIRVWNDDSSVNTDVCSVNTFANINGPTDCIITD